MADDLKLGSSSGATSRLDSVPEEVLIQSGRVMTHFALLERSLADLARALLATSERVALTLTANLSFFALRDLVATLVEEHAPAHCPELRKLYRRIDRAESQKDIVLQCLWGYREQVDGQPRRRMVRRNPNSLSVGMLHETAADIADITRRVDRLRADLSCATPKPTKAASA
ncbi:MAG: hypothetical protein K0S28_1464 [Paucimonas sp.]|nr:hypothetical protein [Paucimonas sp.]